MGNHNKCRVSVKNEETNEIKKYTVEIESFSFKRKRNWNDIILISLFALLTCAFIAYTVCCSIHVIISNFCPKIAIIITIHLLFLFVVYIFVSKKIFKYISDPKKKFEKEHIEYLREILEEEKRGSENENK